MILTRIVSCVPLMLPQCYVVCDGHVMSKCCLYATNDLKVSNEMKKVSIEKIQSSFLKSTIWTKKMEREDKNGQ